MRAIVIGGTGATGTALIDELLQDDPINEVISLVRNPQRDKHPKLSEIKIDFDHLENHSDVIYGDMAFSCLGTTRKAAGGKKEQWKVDFEYNYTFAQIAEQNSIPVFVLQSALNANSNSMFFYSKMKGKLEEAMKELNFKKLVLIRPSILIRPNSDRTGEKLGVKMMQLITNLGLFKRYEALPVKSVAQAMVNSTKIAKVGNNILEVKEIKELSH